MAAEDECEREMFVFDSAKTAPPRRSFDAVGGY